jgi:hypothetical protein
MKIRVRTPSNIRQTTQKLCVPRPSIHKSTVRSIDHWLDPGKTKTPSKLNSKVLDQSMKLFIGLQIFSSLILK